MSEDPIRMNFCGLGNSIPKHYCAHYEEKSGCIVYRNPMKDGALAKTGGDGGKILPYIATLRDGVNDNVSIPTKESDPVLYCALDAFFGDNISWREGCADLPIGCNRGLICKPQVGYKTLLRYRQGPWHRALQYWKEQDGKPVLSLMASRCFSSVAVPETAWSFGLELCLGPVEECLCAMSVHTLLISADIRNSGDIYKFCRPYWNSTPGNPTSIMGIGIPWLHHLEEGVVEDDSTDPKMVRYLLPEGSIKDSDGNIIPANGVSDYHYATLGQKYVKDPSRGSIEKDGKCYFAGIPVKGLLSCVAGFNDKPYAFYSGQNFDKVRQVMETIPVRYRETDDWTAWRLEEHLLWPGVNSGVMPGIYTDNEGRIRKIVGGHYCVSHIEARKACYEGFYDEDLLVGSLGGTIEYNFNAEFLETTNGAGSSWEASAKDGEFLVRVNVYTSGTVGVPQTDAREISFAIDIGSEEHAESVSVVAAPGTPSGVVTSITIDKSNKAVPLARVIVDGVKCEEKNVKSIDFIVKLKAVQFSVSDGATGGTLNWKPFSNEAHDFYDYLHPVYV
jgi:hypothetical protein